MGTFVSHWRENVAYSSSKRRLGSNEKGAVGTQSGCITLQGGGVEVQLAQLVEQSERVGSVR